MIKLRFNRAFTLIELLVVMAIIAILVTLGVTGIMAALDEARVNSAKSFMRKVQMAVEAYQAEYSRFPWPLAVEGTNPYEYEAISPGYNTSANKDATDDEKKDDTKLKPYRLFFSMLSGRCYGGVKKITEDEVKAYNPRQKKFIQMEEGFDREGYELLDPWGEFYCLWYDADENGCIATSAKRQESKESGNAGALRCDGKFIGNESDAKLGDEAHIWPSFIIVSYGPTKVKDGRYDQVQEDEKATGAPHNWGSSTKIPFIFWNGERGAIVSFEKQSRYRTGE